MGLRKLLCVAGILLFAPAVLAACGSGGGSTQNNSPIVIGTSLSLSGDFSADGVAFLQGYQLWADYVNANGGLLGRQVQLKILSDGTSEQQVATNYQTLINVDHVDLLFGPFSTKLTKPASVVANRYGYAFPEGAGGGPSVFARGLNNVFDVSLPVASSLVNFANYILSLPAGQRPATAAYATQDDPFTQPQVDTARQMLEAGGVQTVYYKVYPSETTDFAPIATGIINSKAQVVVAGTLLNDIASFMLHFKQQHYNPQALVATAGPDQGTAFLNAVGGTREAEGVFVPNGGWYPDLNAFQNQQMVAAYLAKYGGTKADISADVPEAYSVGQVVAQAVTAIGCADGSSTCQSKLIQQLHSGKTFQSVQGPVKFDSTGQNTAAVAYLFQWQNGNLIPVYPQSVAAAAPEFPKPNWV
jgi:branched-chain amino acid transport system substrate-binding protein